MSRVLFLILFCVSLSQFSIAQCLTIKSILADACGEPEGANEMVRFEVGAFDLNIQSIVFDWPNNQFLGWCLEPAKTAQLNTTIVSSCGFLKEPTNDILPAGSQVVVISSTDFDVAANSFEGLTDTFYIMYQCAGNTSGHFSNLASSSRTLRIEVNDALCTSVESASYLGTNLVGGDGAMVLYGANGTVSYVNSGCNAPVPNYSPDWSFTSNICHDYGDVLLSDLAYTPPDDAVVSWSGDGVVGDVFNPQGLYGDYAITYSITVPSGCVPDRDSTILFSVDSIGESRDTISLCDSLNFEGNWITSSQEIEIEIENFDEYGCDEIIYRYVEITSPNYSISPRDVTIDSGDSIMYEVVEVDENLVFSWENTLGDSCADDCDEWLYPIENTTYIFSFTDTVSGCTTTDRLYAHLIFYSELNIPNTFTPNGDGYNDVYRAYGTDIADFSLKIYDKWGGVLFSGDSLSDFWDGSLGGRPVESGFYLAVLKAKGKDNRNFELIEKVQLVR